MFKTGDPLPPAVLSALASGRTIDAIKHLCDAHGLSLKEAKDIIDAHVRTTRAKPATKFSAFTGMDDMPATVQEALAQGNKIEAIRLLREHSGIGLKEAKDRVDALKVSRPQHAENVAPGKVPRNARAMPWVAVAAIVALIALVYWRFVA